MTTQNSRAGIACLPLTYTLWLYEALRRYAVNGGLLWFGDGAPEAENLSAALFWTLRFAPCSPSRSP